MIWSPVLVQVNGAQRSFQPSMKVPIAVVRSLTLVRCRADLIAAVRTARALCAAAALRR